MPNFKLDVERDLIYYQIIWIGRVNAIFTALLGIGAGMSLMHVIFLFSSPTKAVFIGLYQPFAMQINILFLVVAHLVLFLCVTKALIYKGKSEEKVRSLDD